MSMNLDAEAKLAEILAKDLSEVSEDDAAFLRARISYLDEAQQDQYAQFLNPAYMPASDPNDGEGEVVLEELLFEPLKDIAREMGIEGVDDRKLFKSKQSLIDAIVAKKAEMEAAASESDDSGASASEDQE